MSDMPSETDSPSALRERVNALEVQLAAARESELRTLFDNLDVGVFTIENVGEPVFTRANPALARILGYARAEDMLGAPVNAHYADPNERRETFAHFLVDPRPGETRVVKFEAVRIRKDTGAPVDVLLTVTCTFDASARVTRLDGTMEDIGDRRRAERAFRTSEARFRRLFETSPVGVVLMDPIGRVTRANAAFLAMLACREEELVGEELALHVHADDREALAKGGDESSHGAEVRFLRSDGELAWGYAASSVLGDEGTPLHHVVMVQDITERKRLEASVLHLQKLESLGLLAGGIAHDFNNILTSLLGNIELAVGDVPPASPAAEALANAETAALRARDLTLQLLTFARGGAPVRRTSSIVEVLRESAAFCLHGSAVTFALDVAPGLPLVDVDAGQMNQVFNNLLINAAQAMPRGGTIRATAQAVVVAPGDGLPLAPGRYVCISVSDEGVGIPPAHVDRVFDPYFSTKKHGSGLGLATAHSIVRRHDGHVEVRSDLGRGSTFRVYLPVSRRSGEDTPTDLRVPRAALAGRVLLMDDEPSVAATAACMLRAFGVEVDTVACGEEAVAAYAHALREGQRYDVVILDLTVVGGMGGADALVELRRLDPTVRAIVSSGYSVDPVMARFREYGFVAVMPKPYTRDELHRALRRALR